MRTLGTKRNSVPPVVEASASTAKQSSAAVGRSSPRNEESATATRLVTSTLYVLSAIAPESFSAAMCTCLIKMFLWCLISYKYNQSEYEH